MTIKTQLLSFFEQGVVEAGCDEAGRGCLAGPVYAAAVILPDDFNDQIISLNHLLISDYKKAKIGKSLVISQTGLIANTPWQNISDKFERNLINHAITIIDPESQAILIQNELGQILNQASYIVRVIEEGEIFEDDLKKKLNDKFNISISNVDLKYLKQIVSERFGKNTKRIKNRSLSKLKEGLW